MTFPKHVAGGVLLAVAALSYAGGAAGQEPAADGTDEIIVEAPRAVPLPGERSPFTGAPIVTSTVRIPVFYHDLDLGRPSDEARLMTRVRRVAQDVCRELDRIHPFNPDADCLGKAVASGTAAAKAAVSAAKGKQRP